MRLSIVKTDKRHVQHLTLKTPERFIGRIQTDTKARDIGRLRQYIARYGDTGGFERNTPVAMIYPSVELRKTENGQLEIAGFNGLVALHVGDLMRQEDIEAVKAAARMLPMTFAAFAGADGRSVEILVSVACEGMDRPMRTEAEMDAFCQSAYDAAFGVYSGILPQPIERKPVMARCCFRMTLDPNPYLNPRQTPLMVAKEAIVGLEEQPAEKDELREVDLDLYADYELLYQRAVEESREETGAADDAPHYRAYITDLAHRLCALGVPEEEAYLHTYNHHVYRELYDDEACRAVFSAVYAEEKPVRKNIGERGGNETRRLINFLQTRYVFRFNTVMGYTEFRPNNTWSQDWQPCDENAINGMTLKAKLNNLDVRDKDVRRYVHSDLIRRSNPVTDYLLSAADKWDGKTDHIAMLARCVHCDLPQWEHWFKKWFLYMVAQWLMPTQEYGNSVVPLLISPQGDGKTSFCRMILPRELRWGFLENQDVSEKRATLQAMHNFLLINLDEFNSISPKIQEGFLKNVIQLPSVKLKRPYGKHVEEFKRYASFIATTNEVSVLSDPTGSRRFICVHLTSPIDTGYKPNYKALYGQAYTLLMEGKTEWWFSPEEVKEIMAHNEQYRIVPPAILYFKEYFETAADAQHGEWMSPTVIYDELRKIAGASLKAGGVSTFGRYLWNLPGLQHRRTGNGMLYLVRKRRK